MWVCVWVCLFMCTMSVYLVTQFEKHGSSLEKTKMKLLEAANLVDKVTFDVMHETNKHFYHTYI